MALDAKAVDLEKMAAMRKKRGDHASQVTRKRDKLRSLLDKGASRERIEEVRAALKNLFDCNAKLIDLSERAGRSEEVPWARMYYIEAENNCSEVLKLAEHRVCAACVLNLSSDCLEDNVDPKDSVRQASQSTKKSSSTTASSARLKATARRGKGNFNGLCRSFE